MVVHKKLGTNNKAKYEKAKEKEKRKQQMPIFSGSVPPFFNQSINPTECFPTTPIVL